MKECCECISTFFSFQFHFSQVRKNISSFISFFFFRLFARLVLKWKDKCSKIEMFNNKYVVLLFFFSPIFLTVGAKKFLKLMLFCTLYVHTKVKNKYTLHTHVIFVRFVVLRRSRYNIIWGENIFDAWIWIFPIYRGHIYAITYKNYLDFQ